MSIEQTLAERGERYGDFTDHAEICQRIKMAMIAGKAKWARLPDTHKQALEVIADKIARILSGDPNYADNWHDIQGYAKLVEDRLPKAPVALDELCPECEYPTDAAGTHYATCSKLTAPKEFVEQVEQTFDELESTATAQPSLLDDYEEWRCLICGAQHTRIGPIYQRAGRNSCKPWCPEPVEPAEEPAAEIDDDSPRQQAIQQNGNDGAVYDDPWFGAPEWAKYKAQDADGDWYWFECPVEPADSQWDEGPGTDGRIAVVDTTDEPNPNWRYTLIQRP